MARNNRFVPRRQQPRRPGPTNSLLAQPPAPIEPAAPIEYGKPIIVMEDTSKATFVYQGGAWVPHERTIADWRQDCLVKELPQRVRGMVRYEVRCPLS
ncbi:MAG TPA: hypothetical protein VFB96_00455 [Pirellulaceae bacterium]|nr:hypothetical protein [Pirellulaceae bacterium]